MVKAWEEKVVIPTYESGKPERVPVFLEKRVYQGSSGSVYPYPVIESVSDVKTDKEYNAVFIENEYIKVMILPELGGRVQMAYDKIKNRHFIYYNRVIKPALVGLAGPWISGGIEINWPQHHRPSTFMPVDHFIESFEDGSVTVWISEIERMTHQKGMAGYTLYPGKAFLEIKGKVYNRTPLPQTFLWWANPAVAVNEHYQSVFPPDVNAVYDHGKRDVSTFPIATGVYYKVDYSAGVDISNYKNIPVPTSYMAINSAYDFLGGYENDTEAGVLHVADHHVSPGKKQWTWGNGEFGKAWDRNLTDEDGPYIELMAGVFTDNQPDFSWLQPYEEKSFTQYFLPYRSLGVVKNANKDILINLDLTVNSVVIKVFATSSIIGVKILLYKNDNELFFAETDLNPENVYIKELKSNFNSDDSFSLKVLSADNKSLIEWSSMQCDNQQIPEAAKPIPAPESVESNDLLYLAGLHLEQYRHATFCPADYYLEALKRDNGDYRCNNAMGLWLMRKGKLNEALIYFYKAVERIQQRNLNPFDGEPLYNLGLCLKYIEENEKAYDYCYKACWNAAWQDIGYFTLSQLSSLRKDWNTAIEEINKSLSRNINNHKARNLKVALLRKSGRKSEAIKLIEESLLLDQFNFGCLFESYLLDEDEMKLNDFVERISDNESNYEELALDYASAGLYNEAISICNIAIGKSKADPMIFYYKALFEYKTGFDKKIYMKTLKEALDFKADYCFPNRIEAISALVFAVNNNKNDSKAAYYLGNLYFDKRLYSEAVEIWEKSLSIDRKNPFVLRNLALAYYNKYSKADKAVKLMEEAFSLDKSDARMLMELDQLYKKTGMSVPDRLRFLNEYTYIVEKRDDLYLEYISVLNLIGDYKQAMQKISGRKFHPWEGGEGKVTSQYLFSRIEQAKKYLKDHLFEESVKLLKECFAYPDNLGEGRLYGTQDNDINYYLGCAYEALGDKVNARLYWEKAAEGNSEPAAAIFYNDQKPEKIFYKGLALQKLIKYKEAEIVFKRLISYGKEHIEDEIKMDYFAVSLPDMLIWEDDLTKKNKIHCLFMQGLGHLGLGNKQESRTLLEKAEAMDNSNQGIISILYNYGL
jgi:tetratricopeptide (TPR) repeat protein